MVIHSTISHFQKEFEPSPHPTPRYLDMPKQTAPNRVNGDDDDDCKEEEDARGRETPTVLALGTSRHLIPERQTKNFSSLFKQVRSV